MPKVNLKYITRMDYGHIIGWYARIQLPNKVLYSKYFSDYKCNGRNKALSKAIAYRNKLVKNLGIEYKLNMPHQMTGPRERFNSCTTGIIGVICTVTTGRNGIDYYAWKGYWWDRDADSIKQRSFAVLKHGECDAFRQACRVRFNQCGTLYIYKDRAKYKTPCGIPRGVRYKFINEAS